MNVKGSTFLILLEVASDVDDIRDEFEFSLSSFLTLFSAILCYKATTRNNTTRRKNSERCKHIVRSTEKDSE
jgi:hypothetical protein